MNLQRSYDLEVAGKESGDAIREPVTPLEKPAAAQVVARDWVR